MRKIRKTHILVIARYPVGGIRTFLRYVYRRFDIVNFKFTILVPNNSELEALKNDLKANNCSFVVLEKNVAPISLAKTILKILKTQNIDVVHTHGFTSLICAAIPSRLYKIPHLFTSHDVFSEKQFLGAEGLLKNIVLGVSFHLVDVIHSVSNDAQENLLSYFPSLERRRSKLVVIQNGIEIERFLVEDRENWKKTLGLAQPTFLIGFFGRFMAQKGFKYLIEAMEIISKRNGNVQPVVLAFGWGGFIREEQAVIKQKGLQDYFYFLPFQENPAVAIRGVDAVVMPSLWEACPLLPMETLLSGIPLIGTDCIGLREVLKETPARMVPNADSRALAEAIIVEMKSSSKEEGKMFRKNAAIRFNVNNSAVRLQLIIRQLAKHSKTNRTF